jgi:hypothetical protein
MVAEIDHEVSSKNPLTVNWTREIQVDNIIKAEIHKCITGLL